jgi:hypothetical protein
METRVYELLEVGGDIRRVISLDIEANLTHTQKLRIRIGGRRNTKVFCATFEVLAAVLKMGSLLQRYAVSTGK